MTNVSGVTETYRARVEEPPGYEANVAPDRITLDPGESATFEVDLVNLAAPIGEWRFGSLSWVDGDDRRVRSPIAVKAAAIEFAEEVSGTGADGMVSVPVAFGYTGAYTAGAHGLSPDVLVPGSVSMDPDQEFDPDDSTGTTAHVIAVADAAFLKIGLDTADLTPANPAIDIDLYLVQLGRRGGGHLHVRRDSRGDHLGGSGQRHIHPLRTWMADDGDHQWHTTSTPGSHRRQRVEDPWRSTRRRRQRCKARYGSVEAGWSGLAPGDYLGAVSHTGDTPLGYTLVEVDNTP